MKNDKIESNEVPEDVTGLSNGSICDIIKQAILNDGRSKDNGYYYMGYDTSQYYNHKDVTRMSL